MAKAAKKTRAKSKPTRTNHANLELHDDAWPRFEALIKSAANMGHKPHETPKPKRKKTKGA